MMKVLALLGSPRKGGNSEILLEAVLRGVRTAGENEVEIVRLASLKISPCIACGGCDRTGECVVQDDMIPLYDKLNAASRVILVSPIYFYGITAQAKCFVDRLQAQWNRKRLLQKKGEWLDDRGRKGVLLSVAATRGEKVFDGAILVMKYACDAMGVVYGGEVLARGIDRRGDMKKREAELLQAELFGREMMLLA